VSDRETTPPRILYDGDSSSHSTVRKLESHCIPRENVVETSVEKLGSRARRLSKADLDVAGLVKGALGRVLERVGIGELEEEKFGIS